MKKAPQRVLLAPFVVPHVVTSSAPMPIARPSATSAFPSLEQRKKLLHILVGLAMSSAYPTKKREGR